MSNIRITKALILAFIVVFLHQSQLIAIYAQDTCDANIDITHVSLSMDNALANWEAGTARLWDIETGQLLHTLVADTKEFFSSLEIAPDNNTVLAALSNHAVLWDVKTGKIKHTLFPQRFETDNLGRNFAAFIAGGKQVVFIGSNSISTWDVETGKQIWNVSTEIRYISLSSQGDILLTKTDLVASEHPGPSILWNLATGEKIREWKDAVAKALSPDGKYVILSRVSTNDGIRRDLLLVDISKDEIFFTHDNNEEALNPIQLSQDGKYLIAEKYTYKNFEVASREIVLLDTHTGDIAINFGSDYSDGYFLPDEQILVITPNPGPPSATLQIYDINSGLKTNSVTISTLAAMPDTGVDLSPDYQRLLVGSIGASITLWNIETGEQIRKFC